MGYSARKATSGPIRPVRPAARRKNDPYDAAEMEMLGIWLGLSRLRDILHDIRGVAQRRNHPFGKGIEP